MTVDALVHARSEAPDSQEEDTEQVLRCGDMVVSSRSPAQPPYMRRADLFAYAPSRSRRSSRPGRRSRRYASLRDTRRMSSNMCWRSRRTWVGPSCDPSGAKAAEADLTTNRLGSHGSGRLPDALLHQVRRTGGGSRHCTYISFATLVAMPVLIQRAGSNSVRARASRTSPPHNSSSRCRSVSQSQSYFQRV